MSEKITELVLISVPHTGTNIVRHILEGAGFVGAELNQRRHETRPTYYTGHMTSPCRVTAALSLARCMPVLCPLRHPYRVEESHRRRGKDVTYMLQAFEAFIASFMAIAHVLPVDVEDRGERLAKLGAALGHEFVTDWPLCRSVAGTHDLQLAETQPSPAVVEMAGRMANFLEPIYGC